MNKRLDLCSAEPKWASGLLLKFSGCSASDDVVASVDVPGDTRVYRSVVEPF